MVRPRSIELFERCYLGGWAVAVVNTLLNWSKWQDDPRIAQAAEQIGSWYLPTTTIIGLMIPLILWYFIARRASAVAKWIMVVLTALGLVGIAISLAMGTFPTGLSGIFGLVGVALNVAAATMLFRADAKPWFGETVVGDRDA